MNPEIKTKLNQLALTISVPFCYSDYIECPTGNCPNCGSDDLMRLVPGVGCDWGTEWIINHILETKLSSVDVESMFEESIREAYPETTKIGWLEYDTASAIKELDPVSWDLAFSEWIDQEIENENILEVNSSYFLMQDLSDLLQ